MIRFVADSVKHFKSEVKKFVKGSWSRWLEMSELRRSRSQPDIMNWVSLDRCFCLLSGKGTTDFVLDVSSLQVP